MARKQLDFGVNQDMTPMIDIVFLLIIFFMLVTEMTLDQAEVVLPIADKAIVVEPQPGARHLTINVSIDNKTLVERMQIDNGPFVDLDELIAALRAEATAYDKWEPNPNNPSQRDSTIEVTIRCDQAAVAGHFHKIFKACQEAKIYRVSIAAHNERVSNPYLED